MDFHPMLKIMVKMLVVRIAKTFLIMLGNR